MILCLARVAPTGADDSSGIAFMTAGDGTSTSAVSLSWSAERRFDRFHVYRALSQDGPFTEIDLTESDSYTDTAAQPGIKYWYAVRGYVYWTLGPPCRPDSGYRKIPQPSGSDFNGILGERNESPEKSEMAEYLKFESLDPVLRPYYLHPLKLNLALYLGRAYIARGAITVLRGWDSYILDPDERRIILNVSPGPCVIGFKSGKLFKIYAAGGQDLMDRLLANAVFYCIYEGDKEIDGPDGVTTIVPRFEALGLSTSYFRNDRDWKDRTILLGTDDREYREKIKSAGG